MGSIFGGGGSSGGGGGGTNTVTTTNSDPWSGVQPYLNQQLSSAQQIYNAGSNAGGIAPQYYPGQTIAGQSPQTQQAITDLTQRATNGSPVTAASQNQVADTLNGNYLDPSKSPYFQGALNNISDAYARGTAAQTAGAFAKDGAYGGSAMTETQGANNQAFANSLMDLGNTQYQQGRTQQLQAAALAPQTANQDYTDIGQLANAGSTQDAYNQNQINANIDKYNYNSNLPYNALLNYKNLTSGTGGSSATQTTPYYQNTTANGLGGAISGGLAGAGLFNAFPSTLSSLGLSAGTSGGIGAAAGGLLGFLSDVRLKENISYAGEANGYNLYAFNYIHDKGKTRYIGVMAQEVMKKRPDAVIDLGDFYTVDYAKLGVQLKRHYH